jgi:hypothetical protein
MGTVGVPRRVSVCFAAVALASAMAAEGAIARSTAPRSSQPTEVHYFHAFQRGKIAPDVQVKRTARGHCWTTSGVEGRRYAWRCFRGNYIHDPCFSATQHGRFALCPIEPWTKTVLRIQLTRSLPRWKLYRSNPALPVGVWTATGKRCTHSSGATSEIAGKPVTYECIGGGLLVGLAHRSAPTWTIYYARGWHARTVTRVGVTDAWW